MKKYFLVGLVVIAMISLTGCSANSSKSAMPTPSPVPTASPASSPASQVPTDSNIAYKDGEYDVVGNYVSPGGPEEIQVKLTLKDNVISKAEVVSKAERPMSVQFQKTFIDNYKPLVVGKKINEVNLTKVSGSSLTPQGFNDALAKIKAKAQV